MVSFASLMPRCCFFPVSRQPNEAAHVVNQVHHPDLGSGSGNADRANQLAAHGAFLETEHMLDTGTDLGTAAVHLALVLRQGLVPFATAVHLADKTVFL